MRNTLLSNILFGIQVLLVFLLLFESKIDLPPAMQVLGRLHPALLHLPIGFLWLLAGMEWHKKHLEPAVYERIMQYGLQMTAVSAALTALFGFFLSKEGDYAADAVLWHKWTGLILNWLCWMALWVFTARQEWFRVNVGAALALTLLSGHLGGALTHGKGYVLAPLGGTKNAALEEASGSAFDIAVMPVFRKKCTSCHNPEKAKGELVLTDRISVLKGGKTGPLWVAGDTLNSLLLQRIRLPHTDEKHMPPDGKAQLSAGEYQTLLAWIQSGADPEKSIDAYAETDPFRLLAVEARQNAFQPAAPTYDFESVSARKIAELNTPFCSVYPLDLQSPALCADFFVAQYFDPAQLGKLEAIRQQLVMLNLGQMPVEDAHLKSLAGFLHLEKLILNGTRITTAGLQSLQGLNNLHTLSLSETKVDNSLGQYLGAFPALREVFVWNTALTMPDVEALRRQFPSIYFESGYMADTSELLPLPQPILKNESNLLADTDRIVLKNPFPGATVLLTFDGSVPASSTSARRYEAPFTIDDFVQIKTQTVKERWAPSVVATFSFFRKGIRADSAEFLVPPNPQYKGDGALSLYDGKKGQPENFREAAWIGCREEPFVSLFYFNKPQNIKSVTLSLGINVPSYIVPPTRIEVWGGADKHHLQLLKTHVPDGFGPKDLAMIANPGLRIGIPEKTYGCIKVVAQPVKKLPAFHPGKGDKGWVFVDEVLFN